jgi:hypothetical protein
MSIYSIARLGTNTTSGQAAIEIIAPSTMQPKIFEVGLFLSAATASTHSFGRPAAIGVTPTSPVALTSEDPPARNGLTTSALAWGTSPTSPTVDSRRINMPATIGTGVIWTFPKGFGLPVSGTAVIQNLATNAAINTHIVVDE